MKMNVPSLSVCVVLAVAVPAVAQTDSAVLAAHTPTACLSATTAWRGKQPGVLRAQGKTPDLAQVLRDAQAMARQCAAQFDANKIDIGQLSSFVDLSIMDGDTVAARAAATHASTAATLTPRQRADVMLIAERLAMLGVDPFAGLVVPAEAIVKRLDSLPDSLATLKITGHQRLLSQYEYADVDDGIQHHAQAILDIARRVRATTPAVTQAMVPAFMSLARAAGDFLHADSALLILDRATKELSGDARAAAEFASGAEMYKLVGAPATPLTGERWVNAPDKPSAIPFGDGKVYLIQFTAHWCVPCRKSYPGLKAVAAQLAGKPFEIVFATELYGNFEGKPATPAEEIADDQTYYKDHQGVPFRVAINPASSALNRAATNEGRYKVGGIPQTVVIDKKGIIRQIVVGGDRGNEARLGKLVAALIAEK